MSSSNGPEIQVSRPDFTIAPGDDVVLLYEHEEGVTADVVEVESIDIDENTVCVSSELGTDEISPDSIVATLEN